MPADVDPRQVAHLERPHREAEIEQDLVHFPVIGAFHDQLVRLFLPLGQHAVADEARADARNGGDLADLARQLHRGRQHVVGQHLATQLVEVLLDSAILS